MNKIDPMFIFIFTVVALCLGFSGCGLFEDLTPPEVLSVYPQNGSANVDSTSVISIVFSKAMERPVTEKAFSLKKSGSIIEGFFSWSSDDKTMVYTPYSGLKRGGLYNVCVTVSAEDKKGIDLAKESSFSFSTSADTVRPFVVSVSPPCGASGISRTTNITLAFSKPIDLSTLASGLVFNPTLDFSVLALTNHATVVLTPVQLLQNGLTYFVTANQDITDLSGNNLLEKYVFYFTVGQPFSNTSLVGIRQGTSGPFWSTSTVNQHIEKEDTIHFLFSRDMSVNGTSGYVTFSPPIQGTFDWIGKKELVFTPDISFNLDQIYSVSVSGSMPDSFGNELGGPVSCVFQVNGTNSIPPRVVSISNGPSLDWIDQQFSGINPDATITNLVVVFSSPMNETRTSIALSVEYICGSGVTGVTIMQIEWSIDDRRVKLKLGGLDSNNTYRIRIISGRDGALDRKGNWFLQDHILHFRT